MSQLAPISKYGQLLRNHQLKFLLPCCSKQMHLLASNDKRKIVSNRCRISDFQQFHQCCRRLSLTSKKYQQQSDKNKNKEQKPANDKEKKYRMIGALMAGTFVSVVGSLQYAEDEEHFEASDQEQTKTIKQTKPQSNKDFVFEQKETNKDFVLGKNREDNPDLPMTVTVLDYPVSEMAPELNDELRERLLGAKVYLVGTAHFSEESQKDVQQTITTMQPDVVMLELCSSRSNMLLFDEETLLKEASTMNSDKVRDLIKKLGMVRGIVYVLLISLIARITKQLGMAPGGEFRTAYRQAQTVHGCRIVLGDRPIQVTLRRAFAALTFREKIKLMFAWSIIMSPKQTISKELVERMKQSDMLEQVLGGLGAEFPTLSQVLINERDQFMSCQLLNLARTTTLGKCAAITELDSWEPAVIVAVVGIGHVTGIVSNWNQAVDMKELMRCWWLCALQRSQLALLSYEMMSRF